MKIAITGHKSGIGKKLYDYWSTCGHDVIGISRRSGFDLQKDQSSVISEIEKCDLFFNNTNIDNIQIDLLEQLKNKVPKIIVSGCGFHQYSEFATLDYLIKKKLLFDHIKLLVNDDNVRTKVLHLGITFLPGDLGKGDVDISWSEIIKTIDFWVKTPCFWDVNFNWKLNNEAYTKFSSMIPDLDLKLV